MRAAFSVFLPRLGAPDAQRQASPAVLRWIAGALLVTALAYAARRWLLVADILEFGDETTRFVEARQIALGDRLYRDIFDQWAPGTMMLAWLARVLGAENMPGFRAVMLLPVAATAAAIVGSRLWERRSAGVAALAMFLIANAALAPAWLGTSVMYQSVGGYLVGAALMLVPLPLLAGRLPPPSHYFLAGAAWMATVYCAFSFAPPLGLFVLATVLLSRTRGVAWRDVLRHAGLALAGALAVTVPFAGWMALHGDFGGFWTYHVHFNSAVFAAQIWPPLDRWSALRFLANALSEWGNADYTPARWLLLPTLAGLAVLAAPALRAGGALRRLALLAAAALLFATTLYLNLRGAWQFHAAATMITWLLLCCVGVALVLQRGPALAATLGLLLAGAAGIAAAQYRFTTIYGIGITDRALRRLGPNTLQAQVPLHRAIREATAPHERIVAWEFIPNTYFYADRSPASVNVYLLPAQMKYVRQATRPGYDIDPCAELERKRPPVVVLGFWEAQNVQDFAPCVVDFVQRHYVAVNTGKPRLYVLPDRAGRITGSRDF